MTPEVLTKFIVLAWPVLIVLAVMYHLFCPDGRNEDDSGYRNFGHGLRWAAIMWFVPASFVLSVPYQGDVFKIKLEDISPIFSELFHAASAIAVSALALGYVCAGLVWAVVHFWLYARRLGQKYVMERDLWLKANNLKTLEGLSPQQRNDFQMTVVGRVKSMMFYEGDFPLRPLQQKRFFGANLVLWPATLVYYVLGDFALDVARRVWFAFRKRINTYWEKGMAEYLADLVVVAECLEIRRKQKEEEDAEREREREEKRKQILVGRGHLSIE